MKQHDAAPELHRSLGFWQVALYGTGSMLGAGIYALIGRAAETLGNAVWLSFLVAMVAALLTGLSYACVGSRFPKAGGAAFITHRAFDRAWLGYVVGIVVMMSGLTSMATGSQAIAENLDKAFGWGVSTKLVAIGIVFIVGLVIFRGIRESMWANIVCTVVEAGGLLFIIVVGMRYWGGVDYLELPVASQGGGDAALAFIVLQGAVLTFFSFIGFEDVLNVSEEVKDAPRNLPRGLIAAMLMSTVIYLLVAITAVSVVPWKELAASKTPLMEVAHRAAPWFQNIDSVFLGITIFAIGNTALLNYIMGSRLLYGMSRQGLLPAFLGRVHATRRTPHVAVATLFCIVAALILAGGVKQLAEATVLLLLMVFTVVNVALLLLKRRKDEPRGQFEVPIWVPAAGALVCATLIVVRIVAALNSDNPASRTAPMVAGAIVLVALLLYAVLRPKGSTAQTS
ncbi:MAG TPA: APC family permease [Chthoniobacterales bacterium]|jgi:amino acid transporter